MDPLRTGTCGRVGPIRAGVDDECGGGTSDAWPSRTTPRPAVSPLDGRGREAADPPRLRRRARIAATPAPAAEPAGAGARGGRELGALLTRSSFGIDGSCEGKLPLPPPATVAMSAGALGCGCGTSADMGTRRPRGRTSDTVACSAAGKPPTLPPTALLPMPVPRTDPPATGCSGSHMRRKNSCDGGSVSGGAALKDASTLGEPPPTGDPEPPPLGDTVDGGAASPPPPEDD